MKFLNKTLKVYVNLFTMSIIFYVCMYACMYACIHLQSFVS